MPRKKKRERRNGERAEKKMPEKEMERRNGERAEKGMPEKEEAGREEMASGPIRKSSEKGTGFDS